MLRGAARREREFFIDNLLVRIHFTIEMIWWTGLAPWEFGYTFALLEDGVMPFLADTRQTGKCGTSLGGVPREQKMLKGHLPIVIYHQVY